MTTTLQEKRNDTNWCSVIARQGWCWCVISPAVTAWRIDSWNELMRKSSCPGYNTDVSLLIVDVSFLFESYQLNGRALVCQENGSDDTKIVVKSILTPSNPKVLTVLWSSSQNISTNEPDHQQPVTMAPTTSTTSKNVFFIQLIRKWSEDWERILEKSQQTVSKKKYGPN